jgi:hypothetical protein
VPDRPLAFVLCRQLPDAAAIQTALQARGLEVRLDVGASVADAPIIVGRDAGAVALLLVDAALPRGEFAEGMAQQIAWPEYGDELPRLAAHLIVASLATVDDPGAAREAAIAVLAVVAALDALPGVVAAGLVSCRLFYSIAGFAARCAAAPLPPDLAVRCDIYRDGAVGYMAATGGLAAFDLPELQQSGDILAMADVHNRLLNLAAYLLANGPVIDDGDTVGAQGELPLIARFQAGIDGRQRLVLLVAKD